MKVAIYTAIFGNKDILRPPINFKSSADVKYYLFTDGKSFVPYPYEQITVEPKFSDISKNAREIKLNGIGKNCLVNFDYLMWHDANIQVNHSEILKLLEINKEFNLSAFKHPNRICVYSEAIACINKSKDDPFLILFQISKYFLFGLPANYGLNATGILLIKNSLPTQKFMKSWWLEVHNFSRRDQLSLPFILYKSNLEINNLEGNIYDNDYSFFRKHNYVHYIKNDRIQKYNTILQKFTINYLKLLRKIKYYNVNK